MKVYITVGDPDQLNGYLNLDALAVGKQQTDISNLDVFVDDGECSEILCPAAIDYFSLFEREAVLGNYAKKLGHGGELIIGGVELEEVGRAIHRGLTTSDANAILYVDRPQFPCKRSLLKIEDMCNLLVKLGLTITSKKISSLNYIVRAVRP